MLVGAAVAAASPPAFAQDRPQVFGYPELRSSDLSLFPKWQRMRTSYTTVELPQSERTCVPTPGDRCLLQQWRQFLDSITPLDRTSQIREVNQRMNLAPYIEDINNWGISDYWATPGEFFNVSGDCEDYAIAKFKSLRLLGFPNEHLRVVVLRDTNLNLIHAVLVVLNNGDWLVLDNQIQSIMPSTAIYHYYPYYSINEDYWWLHNQP